MAGALPGQLRILVDPALGPHFAIQIGRSRLSGNEWPRTSVHLRGLA